MYQYKSVPFVVIKKKHGNTMHDLVETFDGTNRILQSEYIIVQIITRNIVGDHIPICQHKEPLEKVLFITLSPTCSSEIVHMST